MFDIVSPNEFKTTPWKNGKGETVELAINENGTLDAFDWRLSIATVSEDGAFSNFAGLRRDLFLLEGNGIKLIHDDVKTDVLESLYDLSTFDGGSKTQGVLLDGGIKDLNLMTKLGAYTVLIERFIDHVNTSLPEQGLCFVYSHINDVDISNHKQKLTLPKGHLLKAKFGLQGAQLTGENVIVIQLVAC